MKLSLVEINERNTVQISFEGHELKELHENKILGENVVQPSLGHFAEQLKKGYEKTEKNIKDITDEITKWETKEKEAKLKCVMLGVACIVTVCAVIAFPFLLAALAPDAIAGFAIGSMPAGLMGMILVNDKGSAEEKPLKTRLFDVVKDMYDALRGRKLEILRQSLMSQQAIQRVALKNIRELESSVQTIQKECEAKKGENIKAKDCFQGSSFGPYKIAFNAATKAIDDFTEIHGKLQNLLDSFKSCNTQ